jgi:hypothetical protein
VSQRTNNRLQRRDERVARMPGNAPRARRARQPRPAGDGTPGKGLSTTTLAIVGGVIAIGAILVYAVIQAGNPTSSPGDRARAAEMDDSPSLAGTYYPPHPGKDGQPGTGDERTHVAPGVVIPICTEAQLEAGQLADPSYGAAGVCYHSNPPTSGPHSSTPARFDNLEFPQPKENIIHSMEHGGVFIWYNTTDEEAIRLLKSVVDDNRDRRRFVGSTIYTEMEPNTIAITAWSRLDKFPVSELTRERLQRFIDDHHKRFNPEGF